MKKLDQSRRKFISDAVLGTVGTLGAISLMSGCSPSGAIISRGGSPVTKMRKQAPDGKVLKAGLIGCGRRGTGAAFNFLDAGPDLEIVALGDVFQDQLEKCRDNLKTMRAIDVPAENCFSGFESYEKVMDAGVDVVILAAPQHFRPIHVKAAIDAGKHVFQEKPAGVDPVGLRIMEETTRKAKQKKLCMVSGTVRRYQKDYIETQRRVANGEIGEIVNASIIRNGGSYWWVKREQGWTDMEYMLRNWGNFNWLSGDLLPEILVHEIDVMSWHLGGHPQSAIGYGGRHQRTIGDLFDHFSIVYNYDNGKKLNCSNRAISGCRNGKEEMITGTKGYADASGTLYDHKGRIIWEYPYPNENDSDQSWAVHNPTVQEHVELVTAIRTGNYLNNSDELIKSTRIAIMGRMAAYTGREVTWEEVLNSDERLGPERYVFGPVQRIPDTAPVVGTPAPPSDRYV